MEDLLTNHDSFLRSSYRPHALSLSLHFSFKQDENMLHLIKKVHIYVLLEMAPKRLMNQKWFLIRNCMKLYIVCETYMG